MARITSSPTGTVRIPGVVNPRRSPAASSTSAPSGVLMIFTVPILTGTGSGGTRDRRFIQSLSLAISQLVQPMNPASTKVVIHTARPRWRRRLPL